MATLATWEYGPRMERRVGAPSICLLGVYTHYHRSSEALRRARRIWITVHDKRTGPDNVVVRLRPFFRDWWITDLESPFEDETDRVFDLLTQDRRKKRLYLQVWYED